MHAVLSGQTSMGPAWGRERGGGDYDVTNLVAGLELVSAKKKNRDQKARDQDQDQDQKAQDQDQNQDDPIWSPELHH